MFKKRQKKDAPPRQHMEERFEDIESEFGVSKGILRTGTISFQIRNITSYQICNEDNHAVAFKNSIIAAALVCIFFWWAINLMLGLVFGGVAGIAAFLLFSESWHELRFITNAATSYRVKSNDRKFLNDVRQALELAERESDAYVYNFNTTNHTIKRVEANTTTISNSTGVNVVGGSAFNTTQKSRTTITQGLSDVSSLITIVERSRTENTELLKSYLETVRVGLAGGIRSKEEVKSAWTRFVEQAGSIAHTGNNLWELVARVSAALG